MDYTKELRQFLQADSMVIWVGGIFTSVAVIAGLIQLIFTPFKGDPVLYWCFVATGILIGIVFFIFTLHIRLNTKRIIAKAERNGTLSALLHDFTTGGKAFNNVLILGESFIIAKGSGRILTYEEISRIFMYVESQSGSVTKKTLRAVLQNGRKLDICLIPLQSNYDDEMRQVVHFIAYKNRNIHIGQ